jgi:hypothetical protein
MAKIHTHYDNLKVARQAPQEVIRAAYKALSQKYHPDKNPGDEKAARIMAIVNTAYNTLCDPMRRKEHDEWIAAEEWEVEWLESTHGEDGRERQRVDGAAWEPHPVPPPVPYRMLRDPKWWLGLGVCFAAGAALTLLLVQRPSVLPSAMAWGGKPAPAAVTAVPDPAPAAVATAAASETDAWARAYTTDGAPARPPEIRALAVTQLVVPARAPDCDSALQTLAAPNGEPWPLQSGYLAGYPVGNNGNEMQVLVDNSGNGSPVLVRIYDLDRNSNVRHAYVQARATLMIEKLAAGKYEVRYQNILTGGASAECAATARPPLRQATTAQPGL